MQTGFFCYLFFHNQNVQLLTYFWCGCRYCLEYYCCYNLRIMQFFHTAKTFYWIARTASLHYLISLKSFGLFLHGSLQHVFKEKGRRYFGARAFSLPPQSTRLVCTVKHNWKSRSEITARKTDLPFNPSSSLKLATSLISFIIISKDKCSNMMYTNLNTVARKSFSFPHVLLLNENLFLATVFEFL